MRIPNSSTVLVVPAVSANLTGTGGSSDAFNLAGFYGATIIGSTGSNGGGATGVTFKMVRSATSNGTFALWGASLAGLTAGSGKVAMRTFLVNTSATWHKVVYNNNAGGSYSPHAYVLGWKTVTEPIPTQNSNISGYSDVFSG